MGALPTAGRPPELVAAAETACAAIESSSYPLDAAVKWAALTYALDGDFHHWICSVALTAKRATLTFHFGGILDDPALLFRAGDSKLLRRLEYRRAEDVDAAVIQGFLAQAVDRYPWFCEHWRELAR